MVYYKFLLKHFLFEKTISGRESYGDAAMGWVQVKRNGTICTIKVKTTPVHNVKKKQYAVTSNINEQSGEVIDVECHHCTGEAKNLKKLRLPVTGLKASYRKLQEDLSLDDENNRLFKEVIVMGIKNKSEIQLYSYQLGHISIC
nr:unnamed protein product [Callosobruchus chinensis]